MLPVFLISLLVSYFPLLLRPSAPAPACSLAGVLSLVLLNAIIWQAGTVIATRRGAGGKDKRRAPTPLSFRTLRFSVIVFTFLCINLFQWHALAEDLASVPFFLPLAADLLLLLPVLVMLASAMAGERRVAERLRGGSNSASGPVNRRVPSLPAYLLLRFRTELGIVLAPWLLLTLAADTVSFFFSHWPAAETAVSLGLAASLILLGPFLLRVLWKADSLPEGPLRRRLGDFSTAAGFRCSDILIWRTDMQIPNAAVIGIAGFLRYVFITDVLLACCSDDEIEAVFAHEAGHIKHRHLVWHLLLIIAFGASSIALSGVIAGFARTETASASVYTQRAFILMYTFLYWGFFFGYVSRRFEREADVFSIAHISSAYSFISALEKIAALSGRSRGSGGWRHFSIADRTAFLAEAARDEKKLEHARRTALGLKTIAAAITAAAIGLLVLGL